MKNLNFFLISMVQTLLRVLPFPCKTGLVKIGNPGRDAPVLLTGNFRLTVERVRPPGGTSPITTSFRS